MSKFGWSYPPGCTQRMVDEAMGTEMPCSMCGRWTDDCICPECPVCGEYGNPKCYIQSDSDYGHCMLPNAEQIASLAGKEEEWAANNAAADQAYLEAAQEKWPWED